MTVVACVPVRHGVVPSGADEAVAEADGRVVLIGGDTADALAGLTAAVESAWLLEAGAFAPARFAELLAAVPAVGLSDVALLPASPDGRDLAPRLARALDRALLSGAVRVAHNLVTVARYGDRVEEDYARSEPLVVTLEPGCRSVEPAVTGPASVTRLDDAGRSVEAVDATSLEVLAPDPGSMDLAEAPVIVAGGAGLGDRGTFTRLGLVADALGASLGATRVVTDAGWVGHERQIGTTGVTVSPRVYVALGISGAVQHTGGLGRPEHIVSVNLDPSCPMMAMADLAIVADARALVDVLAERLGVDAADRTGGGT